MLRDPRDCLKSPFEPRQETHYQALPWPWNGQRRQLGSLWSSAVNRVLCKVSDSFCLGVYKAQGGSGGISGLPELFFSACGTSRFLLPI